MVELPKRTNEPLSATTTEQEDKTVAGQRKINLIWEVTQAIIAVVVTLFTMGMGAYIVISEKPDTVIPTIFSVAFGMITGFYFSRTNHEAQGGIGPKTGRR